MRHCRCLDRLRACFGEPTRRLATAAGEAIRAQAASDAVRCRTAPLCVSRDKARRNSRDVQQPVVSLRGSTDGVKFFSCMCGETNWKWLTVGYCLVRYRICCLVARRRCGCVLPLQLGVRAAAAVVRSSLGGPAEGARAGSPRGGRWAPRGPNALGIGQPVEAWRLTRGNPLVSLSWGWTAITNSSTM